ncbi:alpha/beta fold hydrolase [Xanthobacter sp. V2C-8]|uniref:alpha/beta hydrolase n=1 Tax=Xanthobacter albus TaxID=3119929 RepID=UPI00372680ED
MTMIAEGPKIAALSCGKPVYLVVLLHGEGSTGSAILDHALNWAPAMPKADFLAAEAPVPGLEGTGRQWFAASDFLGAEAGAAMEASAAALNAFLDAALAARRLPDSHLALVGFSQGAMVALCAALLRPKPVAAVVCFGGALPTDVPAEVRARPQVLMIHGEDDPLVPFAAMSATKERLKGAGVPVRSLRRHGLGHVMDDDGVLAAGHFLATEVVHRLAPLEEHDHDQH